MTAKHSTHASFRENLLEHALVSELLKLSWLKGSCALEVIKPQVDAAGYDIVLEENGVMRHVQLKSKIVGGKASFQGIHTDLANKPSGCVIVMVVDRDTLEFTEFMFFGNKAGEPLPVISDLPPVKHTKANKDGLKAERPALRKVKMSMFTKVSTAGELYEKLFAENS